MKNFRNDVLLPLSAEIEFDFLQNAIQLREKLSDFLYYSDVDVTFDIDKFPQTNFFIPDKGKLCYRIDDQLAFKIHAKFSLEKGARINTRRYLNQIYLAINYILKLNKDEDEDEDEDEAETLRQIVSEKPQKIEQTGAEKLKQIVSELRQKTDKQKRQKTDKQKRQKIEQTGAEKLMQIINEIRQKRQKTENQENEKIDNEELDVFILIVEQIPNTFINYLSSILLQSLTKHLMKNKMNMDNVIMKYTDLSFKLGTAFIEVFMQNLKDDTIRNIYFKPGIDEKYYIKLFEDNKKCDSFLISLINNQNPLLSQQKNDSIKISLLNIFDIEDFKIRDNFYKMLRKILLYKVLRKQNTFPIEYPKMHTQYTTLILRYGSLILESFILHGLFTKKTQKIKKIPSKKVKTQLIVKFNAAMINLSAINLSLQRPFLTQNTVEAIFKYADYSAKNLLLEENISSFHYLLLQYNCIQRAQNYMTHNPNMTTDIKKSYLRNSGNLTTKFVIDRDYLFSFLTLLKYHMLEKTKDIASNLNFESKVKKHENIFLLYQTPIDMVLIFYNKYKSIYYVKKIFRNILSCILNYNINDYSFIRNYKIDLEALKQDNSYNLSNSQKLEINNFINEFYNKIISYKQFIKNLISECLLYSNFRYFTVECFLDSRGRCYYNGFYLNPQTYPITKAFIKLYDPTLIKNEEYSNIVLPIIKKTVLNETYKNLLDKHFYSYELYLKEQYNLREQYLNNLLDININIEKDIVQKYKNIENSFELSNEILNFIKPHIKKIKKLYVVHSMFIRILFFRKGIQNYFEFDATASGLQMTAILFQNRNLADLCNLTNNKDITEDIYDQCSSFLMKNLDVLKNILYNIFLEIPNKQYVITQLLNYYNKYLTKKIHFSLLIKQTEILLGALENLHEIKSDLEGFYKKYSWFIIDEKNIKTSDNKKSLCYLIILRALKMNELRIEFKWLDSWIKSREFCKKAIMTYGYNATPYRRKEEWLTTLLKLNNYQKRTDLLFITIISENLFNFITTNRLKACQWLRELGFLIKKDLEKTILKKELSKYLNLHVTFENTFFNMKLHCFKQVTKRINIKGLQSIRLHQLSVKVPKFTKKTFILNDETKIIRLVKEQNYSLIARKFSPNFIHSMDAFLVHIFKNKLLKISQILSSHNIVINHMTNHDNFSFTLEPFLKIILMDCYDILYRYDYLHTLNKLDFYQDIAKFKNSFCIENTNDLLPGDFFENENIGRYYKPSTLNLIDTSFVK